MKSDASLKGGVAPSRLRRTPPRSSVATEGPGGSTPSEQGADRRALGHLWQAIRPHRGFGLLTLILVVIVFASWPGGQLLFGWALNDVAAGTALRYDNGVADASVLWFWLLVFGLFTLGRVALLYVAQVCRMQFGARVLRSLRATIYAQVLRLDSRWHRLHGAGELISRTTRDGDKIREALYGAANDLLETAVLVLSCLALLCWYDLSIALLPGLLLLVVLLLLLRQAGRLTQLNRQADNAYDHLIQDLTEGVEGVHVIKAFGLEQARTTSFAGHVDHFSGRSLRTVLYTAINLAIPLAVFALGHGWVLVVGAWQVSLGTIEVGDLVAALMAMTTLIFRLDSMGNAIRRLADARASLLRLGEVLEAEPAFSSGPEALPAGPLGLQLHGVVAGPPGHPVLDGVELELRPGEVLALVGPTGGGKSLLAQLLPRLLDPDAGEVAVIDAEGTTWPLPRLRLDELRRTLQVAFQDSFLFAGTIRENLQVAAPEADDQQLWQALEDADLATFIRNQADGLDSLCGERGLTLSGGQLQRLCLARALVGQPRILIADDSTSALDAATEARVLTRLRQRADGISIVLIASRLATARLADRICLLDEGRIVASGTPDELATGNALYRELMGL